MKFYNKFIYHILLIIGIHIVQTIDVYTAQDSSVSKQIKRATVRYIDWKVQNCWGSLGLEFFFDPRKQNRLEIINFTELKEIQMIEKYMNEITNSDTIQIDVCSEFRLICLVEWSDASVDTVGYGDCFVILHNQINKRPNLAFLEFIVAKMKPNYREDVYYYISELRKYQKCK